MRKGLLLAFGICVMGNGQVFGQLAAPVVETWTPAEKFTSSNGTSCPPLSLDRSSNGGSGYQTWASADYLLWWVRNAPLPTALVTTGNPATGVAAGVFTSGAIGQPGTQVLFGNSSTSFGAMSGMRFTVGQWLDSNNTIGIEGTGFLIFRQSTGFATGSDGTGNPPLYFPVFSPTANGGAGAERAFPISEPTAWSSLCSAVSAMPTCRKT
jgi:hypothetical protein